MTASASSIVSTALPALRLGARLRALVLLALCPIFGFGSPAAHATEPCEVSVYAYDSFLSARGLGPKLFDDFKKLSGCGVRALAVGDGGQLVTRLQLDRKRGAPPVDVVLGLDAWSFRRAQALLDPAPPLGFKDWAPELKGMHWPGGFLPFDFGLFAFMADTSRLDAKHLPQKLADLLEVRLRRQLILQDPRTSTPGLGFLLYVKQTLGDQAAAFWAGLRSQWLTLAPGWDGAYGIFLKGEAPLVWSYVTSEAYHREHEPGSNRYRALLFEEGQPAQVEGAAISLGISPARRANAVKLLERLLSPEIQAELPRRQWMMPARGGVTLPGSFAALPRPKRVVELNAPPAEELSATLKQWGQWVAH